MTAEDSFSDAVENCGVVTEVFLGEVYLVAVCVGVAVDLEVSRELSDIAVHECGVAGVRGVVPAEVCNGAAGWAVTEEQI